MKTEKYEELCIKMESLLSDEPNLISVLSNAAALIHDTFDFWWTGFYLVENDELILGPFQGPVACMHIAKGRGVCGTAWVEGRTIIVPDVDKFPGHIACSSASRSEIVVPVYYDGLIMAVLDVDSVTLDSFDEVDAMWLEKICSFIWR